MGYLWWCKVVKNINIRNNLKTIIVIAVRQVKPKSCCLLVWYACPFKFCINHLLKISFPKSFKNQFITPVLSSFKSSPFPLCCGWCQCRKLQSHDFPTTVLTCKTDIDQLPILTKSAKPCSNFACQKTISRKTWINPVFSVDRYTNIVVLLVLYFSAQSSFDCKACKISYVPDKSLSDLLCLGAEKLRG